VFIIKLHHILIHLDQIFNISSTVLQELIIDRSLLEVASTVGIAEPLFHRIFEYVDTIGCFVCIEDNIQIGYFKVIYFS
jgi:hypothetical protein